jgi:8-oxo-dGTP diphosphatase
VETYLVVAGLISEGDKILLVSQKGDSDPAPSFALPGGRVEPGELLTDALVREVREETGLDVIAIGPLLYSLQLVNAQEAAQTLAYVFHVAEWRGALRTADPDGFVRAVGFYPRAEAIMLLEQTLPWRQMREPIVAYLRGEAQAGAVWLYRAGLGDECELVERLG